MFKLTTVLLFVMLDLSLCLHGFKLNRLWPRITGGTIVSGNTYPFMAYISTMRDGSEFVCGGSLVSENYVVTAAHCAEDPQTSQAINPQFVKIGLGASSIGSLVYFKATKVIIHPGWSRTSMENDIALIRIDTSGGKRVSKGIIKVLNSGASVKPNAVVRALGWGKTDNSATDVSQELRQVDLAIESSDSCNKLIKNKVQRSFRFIKNFMKRGFTDFHNREGDKIYTLLTSTTTTVSQIVTQTVTQNIINTDEHTRNVTEEVYLNGGKSGSIENVMHNFTRAEKMHSSRLLQVENKLCTNTSLINSELDSFALNSRRAQRMGMMTNSRSMQIRDTCLGDSGGPLMYYSGGTWNLVGITSYGIDKFGERSNYCGIEGGIGFYTYVPYYSDFILQTTKQK